MKKTHQNIDIYRCFKNIEDVDKLCVKQQVKLQERYYLIIVQALHPSVVQMELTKDESMSGDVQIKADLKEIRRRITAFQARKRRELDELNLQEFCSRRPNDSDVATADPSKNSCCRVDAVVIRRADSKSHIKVSRVENQWGPQMMIPRRLTSRQPSMTQNSSTTIKNQASSTDVVDSLPVGVEERIHNMEAHLRLKSGKPISKDIYSRLKNLEDRILFLESISPDYFADQAPRCKMYKTEGGRTSTVKRCRTNMSMDDIDERIRALRGALLHNTKPTQI